MKWNGLERGETEQGATGRNGVGRGCLGRDGMERDGTGWNRTFRMLWGGPERGGAGRIKVE